MRRRRADSRAVDGILLLDKPRGLTSNAALQRVKRLYKAAKAGHTGSLDPLATGLLPICLGEATKLSGFLLNADKRYIGSARLGARTDTGDAEGRVVATSDASTLQRETLAAALPGFLGPQQQVPPMYSALKQDGRPLYQLARQGAEVERQPREIVVHQLRLTGFGDGGFDFDLRCSKGTYVRTLIEDIAAAVGQCAHITALRRLELDGFSADDMVTPEALEAAAAEGAASLDAHLLPLSAALAAWPRVLADPARAFYLRHGQAVHFAGAPAAGRVAVYDADGRALAIAEIDDCGRVAPRRLLHGA